MIVLDTHVWIWWVSENDGMTENQRSAIAQGEKDGIGVSAISCWEVAKLVQLGRLELDRPVAGWLELALSYPGVRFLDLRPSIAVLSTTLPGEFHRDPADQIIVATALHHQCGLVTSDRRIVEYGHVDTISSPGHITTRCSGRRKIGLPRERTASTLLRMNELPAAPLSVKPLHGVI